ncbi:MAG: flagellar biosynthetic protein FliP, partial [Bdellovibrionales bacterium]|nr:flagellar biosynthetic protein FliP [Bdellovibrionales bacterium]
QEAALDKALGPIRQFMFSQTRESDLALFIKMAKVEKPKTRADVPTSTLIPAFIISELKTAFQIGFIIYLPFLVIDMVAASVLMAMGMMMLPPVIISLPFKIMLFVFVDGWALLVGSLVESFGG